MEKFITYPSKGRTITVLATGHKKCNTSLTLTVKLNKRQTGTYRMQFNAAPFDRWAQGLEFRSEHGYTTRKRYVVKHNLITEVYLMTVMETTTCFGPYWPSSGCLGNVRASYMHARARGVEISTYA